MVVVGGIIVGASIAGIENDRCASDLVTWHKFLFSDLVPIGLVSNKGCIPSCNVVFVVPKIVIVTVVVVGVRAATVVGSCIRILFFRVIVGVGLFASVELVVVHSIRCIANRKPVCPPNLSEEIDATLRLEATGSDITVAPLRRINVVEPKTAVMVGGTLRTSDSGGIAVSAWEKESFLFGDRVHEDHDTA